MLKMAASGTKGGQPWRLVILGLSHVNLQRLKEGRPIMFDGTEIGLPPGTEILIFAGATEQAMARDLFGEIYRVPSDLPMTPTQTTT